MIEMMGYLVRTAVEDSPYLEPLLEKNHQWMARIIEASDFEELSGVLRNALDDFMNNIYLMGYRPGNTAVQKAMEYLGANYRDPISLADVAEAIELSESRTAHLIKGQTGRSMLQHVHRLMDYIDQRDATLLRALVDPRIRRRRNQLCLESFLILRKA